ncbi:unnamed protein product [Phytophthora fragariaefolia]|uniref:Unnamed protein product n=1 Tax=Phytophthora fragariaefolia TaxID=1490495 RepID=A0A9W6XWQ8_9STRA|nr:unnamed protein product [Phytophthora fragariaefolia]
MSKRAVRLPRIPSPGVNADTVMDELGERTGDLSSSPSAGKPVPTRKEQYDLDTALLSSPSIVGASTPASSDPVQMASQHADESEDIPPATCAESQNAGAQMSLQLSNYMEYVKTIPTQFQRAKLRHQPTKRPTDWHVARSRKRHHQTRCAITRNGTQFYHAWTVKAKHTKEFVQIPGMRERLRALHHRRPVFVKPSSDGITIMTEMKWPASVKFFEESEVPEGIQFADIGDREKYQCHGDCFIDSCTAAQLAIYCISDCCGLDAACSNAPRTLYPPRRSSALRLYDTGGVGLGGFPTAYLEVGDVVG